MRKDEITLVTLAGEIWTMSPCAGQRDGIWMIFRDGQG